MKSYYLMPKHTAQKDFNHKAVVIDNENGTLQLKSYETIVAEIVKGDLRIHGWYSATTARHINEFLQQNGFETLTKSEMEDMAI